jgi:hypothetical protein
MSGYEVVETTTTLMLKSGAVGNTGQAKAVCPAGKVAVGGGYRISFGWSSALGMDGVYPGQGGWVAAFRNNGLADLSFTTNVFAVCVFVDN